MKSNDEDNSGAREVEETGYTSEEGDGERAGDWLLLSTTDDVDSGAILLEDCSSSSEELAAAAIRLEATLESVANFERMGFTFTRIGRREWPGRVRTELLVTRTLEELGEIFAEDEMATASLLSRGVSTTAEEEDGRSGELNRFPTELELSASKEGVKLGVGVVLTIEDGLARTEVGLILTSRTISKEM